jgi:hypothetical protein
MDTDILVVSLAALAVVFLLGGFAAYVRHSGRKRLDTLSPAFELGTTRLVGPLGNTVEGLYQGYTCRYTVRHPTQHDRGGANIRLFASSPHSWSAEVDTPGSRFFVKVGLLKDLEIGDHDLDQRLRFSASDESAVRSIFGVGGVRTAMHALADSENFAGVGTREGRIDVKFEPRAPELDDDPEALRARLDLAVALVVACGYPPAHRPPT